MIYFGGGLFVHKPIRYTIIKKKEWAGKMKKSIEKDDFTTLIGKIAITDTDMSPSGTILIDGEIFTAETDDGYVEAGRGVKVTRVRGKKIFIRRV